MDFIKNLKIGKKLSLLLLLPLLGIIYFSTDGIISKYHFFNEMKSVEHLAKLSAKIGYLVHETQKERGATGGFFGSKSGAFVQKLSNQRMLTDKSISELNAFLSKFHENSYDNHFIQRFTSAMNALQLINYKRKGVDDLSISKKEALDYFTNMHADLLEIIKYIAAMSSDPTVSASTTAYLNFLVSKENVGIERAYLTAIFASNKTRTKDFDEVYVLVGKQSSSLALFKEYATEDQIKFYDETVSKKIVNEAKRMRSIFESSLKKIELSGELNRSLGFGGLIHQFKNYILRSEEKYLYQFNQYYTEATESLDKLESIENITDRDKKDITYLRTMVNNYNAGIKIAVNRKKGGATIQEVDGSVKIDDSKANKALEGLLNGGDLGIDPINWFDTMTKKINSLHKVENKISADLILHVEKAKAKAMFLLVLNLFFTLMLFIIAGYFTVRIVRTIVDSL